MSEKLEKRLENVLWSEIEQRKKTGQETGKVYAEVSVSEGKQLKRIWSRIINIGYAGDLLQSEVQEHTLLLKETLRFEYVRFWNPFSKELLIDINNPEHKYNFSRLDSILDFLVKHDIRPVYGKIAYERDAERFT